MPEIVLTGDSLVRDILTECPDAFSVFEQYGMCDDCKVQPPPVPLHHFSTKHGVALDQLISELTTTMTRNNS